MVPVGSARLVQTWLEQLREMWELIERKGPPPMAGVTDVREPVQQAIVSGPLEPEQLAAIADTLAATRYIRQWLDDLDESTPLTNKVGERIGDFGTIADEIRRAIDAAGQVRDEASKKLTKIRISIEEAKRHIDKVFDRLLKSTQVTRCLQYASTTFHNDRTVLPLKAEFHGRVPGIVHRSSETGATLFVEPAEAVALNNTIVKLRQNEHEEIGRILWKLSQQVHLNADAIVDTLKALGLLDLLAAKVDFGKVFEMTVPQITKRTVDLRAVRHPLLLDIHKRAASNGRQASEVVPIDVRLGEDFDMLVITGPNTGGKTVALKTLGLCALMAQAGLPIPAAASSRLCVFDDVLIDVGDEQSLQQSLSTFSSHVSQILRMMQRAKPTTLVLIDELGSGTDPDEGAAIGRAVMDEFLKIGCLTMLTTHLGALKAVGYTHKRVDNASVEFDVASLKPLYKLRIGEPGNSNALAIARRLGLPRRMVREAESHFSGRQKALKEAISGTLESRRKAEDARTAAAEAKAAAESQKAAYEKQLHELERRRADFDQWIKRVSSLRPGDKVHVRRFDRQGTVIRLQLHKQSALVSVGAMEMELSLAEISPVEE
jgi:DNA mismatch repair protein MutS2